MTDLIKPTPQQVLDLELPENDANAPTVRAYLGTLLMNVWIDGEGFNGKRPFGNSGWQGDFDRAFIRAGWVDGTLDEDGYVDSIEDEQVDRLMRDAIKSLSGIQESETAR